MEIVHKSSLLSFPTDEVKEHFSGTCPMHRRANARIRLVSYSPSRLISHDSSTLVSTCTIRHVSHAWLDMEKYRISYHFSPDMEYFELR